MNPKSTSYNSYIRLLIFNLTLKMLNRLTAMVAYLRPLFFLALFEPNRFSNFCLLSTFDS